MEDFQTRDKCEEVIHRTLRLFDRSFKWSHYLSKTHKATVRKNFIHVIVALEQVATYF